MNMVLVSDEEMMEVDGGRGSRSSTRHERSGAGQNITDEARKEYLVFLSVGAISVATGGNAPLAALASYTIGYLPGRVAAEYIMNW